jgi:hypothetical protein
MRTLLETFNENCISSKYFAAMFQHPTKEQSTDQIKIEDIEPQVFQELLRFIYTGRVGQVGDDGG